jgi:hypothetical protein
MRDVIHDSGSGAIQANKTQAAHYLLRGIESCERFFIAEAVLQRQQHCVDADKRRKQSGKRVIRRRFQRDDNEITIPDLFRMVGSPWPDGEIALRTVNANTAPSDYLIVGTHKKMSVVPGTAEPGAIVAPDSATTHNRDFHDSNKKGTLRNQSAFMKSKRLTSP